MEVPYFIFEIFEKELRNIQINLLKKVATKKGYSDSELEELCNEFLPEQSNLKLVPNTKTRIHIQKKNAESVVPKNEERCMARIWNRGKGGQCTRARFCNEEANNELSEYCSQHIKNRKHGRIDEKPSEEIFPKDSKSLYK